MPEVVGIRFKRCGKIYDFEVEDLEIENGDSVVVESELGLSIGNVVVERHPLEGDTKDHLKKVLRKASEEDIKQRREATLDRKRIIFYFAAEGRIDFRELVKDLAAKFKTRIEMRQIGVRDEAKMLGGIGICGLELCCKRFLTTFEPISIRMAKSQELVLNANKLSGVCGRLMCCLSYEYSEEDSVQAAVSAPAQTGDYAEDDFRSAHSPVSEEGTEAEGRPLEEKQMNSSGQRHPDTLSIKMEEAQQTQAEQSAVQGNADQSAGAGADLSNADEGKKFRRRKRRRRRRHRR
jgi:cell fate regulator YaaT (PSP1 superfamily)